MDTGIITAKAMILFQLLQDVVPHIRDGIQAKTPLSVENGQKHTRIVYQKNTGNTTHILNNKAQKNFGRTRPHLAYGGGGRHQILKFRRKQTQKTGNFPKMQLILDTF